MIEARSPPSAYTVVQGDPVPRTRCNPRRAYDCEGREVTMHRAFCPPRCQHEGLVPLERIPPAIAIRDVGLRLGCTACGRRGPETEPA